MTTRQAQRRIRVALGAAQTIIAKGCYCKYCTAARKVVKQLKPLADVQRIR